MEKIYNSLIELIGNTPLLYLNKIKDFKRLECNIIAKLESFNPGGSVKDRVALSMIEQAEKDGILKQGSIIIEPTSGNTGIGLAWVASLKGYELILTMPETMSIERRNMLKALGAKLILTPGAKGMKGAIDEAEKLKEEIPNSTILQQFNNPANPNAHINGTAKEIWEATGGNIDFFVSCVGTGGTLCGTSTSLKEYNSKIISVGVEPESSPVLQGGEPGVHKIQGIGAGFIPGNYNPTCVDKIISVSDDNAFETARLLAAKEGILCGISSGAALYAAMQIAEKNKNKNIIVVLPDTGERYLSTPLFNNL